MVAGYMRMIESEDEGGDAEIADVFKGFEDFVPALVAVLVGFIIVLIGYVMCILLRLLIMAIVPTATCSVAMGEKDGINALKQAWNAVKGNLQGAFLCMLVLGILGKLGLMPVLALATVYSGLLVALALSGRRLPTARYSHARLAVGRCYPAVFWLLRLYTL